MDDVLDQLDQLRRTERRVAMATLVAAKGTTPKKEGAKMWVGEGGRILGSVTIGGCVDARVIEESERALAQGKRALLTMSLGDEEAWEIGLTCGGAVDVLVEPLDLAAAGDPAVQAYETARAELDHGRGVVVVVPLDAVPGRLVVREDGSSAGTLGSVEIDAAARREASTLLRSGQSAVRLLDATGTTSATRGFFFERLGPPPTVIVHGATQVAMTLVPLAKAMGMRVVVVDGRERFATPERFPQADEIRIGMPSEIAASLPATPTTAIVLVAHDYKYELPVLRHALRSNAGYVGMLGNRKRGAAVKQLLAEEGFTETELARVHTPIGLNIGAASAAEIALSILAEIVATHHGAESGAGAAGAPAGTALARPATATTETLAGKSAPSISQMAPPSVSPAAS
jgi:xanthine dehydrogenase accessory factor